MRLADDGRATELIVLPEGAQLLGGAAERNEPGHEPVGIENGNVKPLDATLLLEASIQANRFVEYVEASLLASAYGRPPGDHQNAVGHADPLCYDPASGSGLFGRLSHRRVPGARNGANRTAFNLPVGLRALLTTRERLSAGVAIIANR